MSAHDTLASRIINVTVISGIPVIRPLSNVFLNDQAREFKRIITALRKRKYCDLVVDLASCEYISSEGLGAVAEAWEWSQEKNYSRMSVVLTRDARSEVVNLFEITGLSRSIGCCMQPGVAEAVRFIKQFCDEPETGT